MADNINVTPGSGKTVLADEVVDGTLGTGIVQFVKIMDGTLDGSSKATVGSNGLAVATSDVRPSSGTLTTSDVGSTTITGMNSVTLVTGTATAGSTYSQAINGQSSATILVTTITTPGPFSAAIEGSADSGTTWAPISGLVRGTNITTATVTGNTTISADVTGFTNIRVRQTVAATTGTPTVRMVFSAAAGMTKILNSAKLVDSGGADVSDTTFHAIKVSDAIANAAAPTRSEGAAGPLSTDLHGSLRATMLDASGAAIDFTAASPVTQSGAWNIGGFTVCPSSNFTRPADTTAYAIGDLIANSTTAASVTPMTWTVARVTTGSGMVRRARVKTSATTLTNASFRLHLYMADPSASTGITNGDNGAWLTKQANYLGSLDVTFDRAFSDAAEGVAIPNNGSDMNFVCGSGSQLMWGLLEARAAYTPTSAEVFTVELEILQN